MTSLIAAGLPAGSRPRRPLAMKGRRGPSVVRLLRQSVVVEGSSSGALPAVSSPGEYLVTDWAEAAQGSGRQGH